MGELQLLFPLHRALEAMLVEFEFVAGECAPDFLIPAAPVPLEEVLAPLEETCPGAWDGSWQLPWDLPGRNLISLVWSGGHPGGGSFQSYTACQLPGGQRVYARSSDGYPSGFVAMTWDPDPDAADRHFLLSLLATNGRDFGIEVLDDGAPTEVRVCDLFHWTSWWTSFLLLFEVASEESDLDLASFYGLHPDDDFEEGADPEDGSDDEPDWGGVFEWWFEHALPEVAKDRARECAR